MNWTIGNGIQILAGAACIALLIAAAVGDVRHYRISNRLVIAVVVCFAVFAVAKGSWYVIAWSVAAAACMFAIAAVLFAFGLFGGGDAKLIAAVALWIPFVDLPRFLLVMTAFGGLLGVVWMIRRNRLRKAAAAEASSPFVEFAERSTVAFPDKLPYGVAITIAGIDFFLFSANSPLAGVLSGQ